MYVCMHACIHVCMSGCKSEQMLIAVGNDFDMIDSEEPWKINAVYPFSLSTFNYMWV